MKILKWDKGSHSFTPGVHVIDSVALEVGPQGKRFRTMVTDEPVEAKEPLGMPTESTHLATLNLKSGTISRESITGPEREYTGANSGTVRRGDAMAADKSSIGKGPKGAKGEKGKREEGKGKEEKGKQKHSKNMLNSLNLSGAKKGARSLNPASKGSGKNFSKALSAFIPSNKPIMKG